MDAPILHHYAMSPYSEKIRPAFGLKNIAWQSLEVNWIMPRPYTLPLTGGYRRIPILQCGADIYCDTQLIAREIERRYPQPSLLPAGSAGLAHALGAWAGSGFFMAAAVVAIGGLGDKLPQEFIDDREGMPGSKFDFKKMQAMLPAMREQYRAHVAWIDEQLADGREWLITDAPSWADLGAYTNCWFVRANAPNEAGPLEKYPRVIAWMDRIAAAGHGEKTEITGEQALTIARQAEPQTAEQADPDEPNGLKPGDAIQIMADDYGTNPISGELVSSSAQHVALRQHNDEVGNVVIHFPRAGYVVMPAQ